MRPYSAFLKIYLMSLLVLGACVAPIATSPAVDSPGTSFQLIEFYSPL